MSRSKKFYLLIALQIVFLLALVGAKVFTLQTGEKILLEIVPVDPRDIFRGEYARLSYKISTIKLPEAKELKKGAIVYAVLKKGEKFWEVERVDKVKPADDEETFDKVIMIGKVSGQPYKLIATRLGNLHNVTKDGWLEANPDAIAQIKTIERPYVEWKQGDTIYVPFVQNNSGTWDILNFNIYKNLDMVLKNLSYEKRNIVVVSAEAVFMEEIYSVPLEYGIESYYVPEGKAVEIERVRQPAKVSVEVSVDRFGNSAINRIFIDDKPIDF